LDAALRNALRIYLKQRGAELGAANVPNGTAGGAKASAVVWLGMTVVAIVTTESSCK